MRTINDVKWKDPTVFTTQLPFGVFPRGFSLRHHWQSPRYLPIHHQDFPGDESKFKKLINLTILTGCYWLWLWMPQNEHPDENVPFHLRQKGGAVLPLSNGLLWPWNNCNLWLGKSPLIKNSCVAKMVTKMKQDWEKLRKKVPLSDWSLGWPFKNRWILFGITYVKGT